METLHPSNQDHSPAELSLEPESLAVDAGLKEKHQRLFQRGLRWLGMGILLMGLSFGINFLLFHSDTSFITAMYILTSLGAICVVKGLADILGF